MPLSQDNFYCFIFISGFLSRTNMGNPVVFPDKRAGCLFPGILPNCIVMKETGLTDNIIVCNYIDIPPEMYEVSRQYKIYTCIICIRLT